MVCPHSCSTAIHSFEEYDLDTDELNDELQLIDDGRRQQDAPLLVGLIDSSNVRRGADGAILMRNASQDDSLQNVDLEELARRRQSGGSLFDSVANMANSILGAGMPNVSLLCFVACS